LPEMAGGVAQYKTTPAEFAESVPELVEAGATFVGGCCGTTPDFIRQIAQLPELEKSQGKVASSEK
jgi:5-methyltetrahydrofolate--homocysteine methyltransferase